MTAEKIKSEVREGINFIALPPSLVMPLEPMLQTAVKNWLELPVELHILDFSAVVSLDPSLYRVFTNFKNALKTHKKHLASMNVRSGIVSEIRSSGILSVFSPVSNLAGAKTMAGIVTKTKLDVKLLDPFVQATIHMMKTQVQLDADCGKPYIKKSHDLPVEIAGLIDLRSSDLPDSIAICFSQEVFLKIYEMMVGEKHDTINQEIQDAASEILNIIFGQAKTVLLGKGIRLERVIPKVLVGPNVKKELAQNGPAMILPFTSPIGPFHMEVVFK